MVSFNTLTVKYYPGKTLLVGEYTVLLGGAALAIPLDNLYAWWDYSEKGENSLNELTEWLKNQDLSLDLKAFQKNIDQGLILRTNIPEGYGCGSSGTVAAAITDLYYSGEEEPELVQKVLKGIEDYFHNKSSGIDPVVSYYQMPALSNSANSKITHPNLKIPEDLNLFLYDTGIKRLTSTYVTKFLNRIQREGEFEGVVRNLWIPLSEELINKFIKGGDPWNSLRKISEFQYTYMEEWFVTEFDYEAPGIRKLNGAGGGGFLQIWCNNDQLENVREYYNEKKLLKVL